MGGCLARESILAPVSATRPVPDQSERRGHGAAHVTADEGPCQVVPLGVGRWIKETEGEFSVVSDLPGVTFEESRRMSYNLYLSVLY